MACEQDQFDGEDPRLTAYALGELDGWEAAEVEALLLSNGGAQEAVEEIRAAAGLLGEAFCGELGDRIGERRAEVVFAGASRAGAPAVIRLPLRREVSPWVRRIAFAA